MYVATYVRIYYATIITPCVTVKAMSMFLQMYPNLTQTLNAEHA